MATTLNREPSQYAQCRIVAFIYPEYVLPRKGWRQRVFQTRLDALFGVHQKRRGFQAAVVQLEHWQQGFRVVLARDTSGPWSLHYPTIDAAVMAYRLGGG